MKKRGQGLSTNAIVLIILAVVVLVVLAIGFTMGWNKLAPWIGGGSNVDTIVQQCSVACATNSVNDYCNVKRDLTKSDGNKVSQSCITLSKLGQGIGSCGSVPCDCVASGGVAKSSCDTNLEIEAKTGDTTNVKCCVVKDWK
ncbi:MAG: hypothetical protein ABIA78_00355 [archaeon]